MDKCRFYNKELNCCGKLINLDSTVESPISFDCICNPDCCEDFEYNYYPTLEEIEKEYKKWVINLLKVRFDLKPEYYDPHQHNNFTYENCADCLWNKVKNSIEELLYLKRYKK